MYLLNIIYIFFCDWLAFGESHIKYCCIDIDRKEIVYQPSKRYYGKI